MKPRPGDINRLGKLIVDIAVGDVQDEEPKSNRVRGGIARAAALTPEQRREIAIKAAAARWQRKAPTETTTP